MPSAVKVKPGFRLAELDLERRLADEASYQQKLRKLQIAMLEVEEIYRVERRRGIIALEGWDASGKSGAIQRLIEKLDPRWVDVWPIGRPNSEEQGRHYLWRFWQRLPLPGQIAIFDRTWYGRVLVERVEGLARPKEWRRAYDEINAFEKMLVDDGVRLVNYSCTSPTRNSCGVSTSASRRRPSTGRSARRTSATARIGAITSRHSTTCLR
jgi:AMP-polyphosphate phosphotransferase